MPQVNGFQFLINGAHALTTSMETLEEIATSGESSSTDLLAACMGIRLALADQIAAIDSLAHEVVMEWGEQNRPEAKA